MRSGNVSCWIVAILLSLPATSMAAPITYVIPVGDPGGGHALDDRYFRATANVTLADEVPVPEPKSLALLVLDLGLAALAGGRATS